MTSGSTESVDRREPRGRAGLPGKYWLLVGLIVGTVLVAAIAVAVADPDADGKSRVSVPEMGVVVEGIPSSWSMRPGEWVLTRMEAESGELVAATSTWWPTADVDRHNTFEICVERIDQATCPVDGPLVVRVSKPNDETRASISILPRTPPITNESDVDRWLKVAFK